MGRAQGSLVLRRVAIVAALAGLLVLATVAPASAESSDAPCWKRVTLDWADNGVVDKTYPVECYQQAIDNATADVSMYSSFVDDMERARQRAIAGQHGAGGGAVTIAPDKAGSSGDGVPTPLLVLGGIALVLVAVGTVGLFRRRGRGTA
jgi:hypothetical protein